VGPRAVLDAVVKRKIPSFRHEQKMKKRNKENKRKENTERSP
jgi:hypothetical protein